MVRILDRRPVIPARGDELEALAARIKQDLTGGDDAARERLRRYRSAGDGLNWAKKLLAEAKGGSSHGSWEAWLQDNFALSDRQARKYMAFAKTAPGADLDEEEEQWRRASGKGKVKKPKAKKPSCGGPDQHDDGSWVLEFDPTLAKEEAEAIRPALARLKKAWAVDDNRPVVLKSILVADRLLNPPLQQLASNTEGGCRG